MRDEVVVGLSLPLPQAGQSLLMELKLQEDFWILLQIPSRRRCGFTPGAKDIPLSSRKSHESRCNPARTWDFSSCVHWPGVVPRAGKFQGQEPTNHSFDSKTFPAFYFHKLCLFSRAEGAGTSPCLFNTLQSQPLPQSCPELIKHFLVTWIAPFSHPQNAHSFKVQTLLNWCSYNKQTVLNFQIAGASLNTALAQTSLAFVQQKKKKKVTLISSLQWSYCSRFKV